MNYLSEVKTIFWHAVRLKSTGRYAIALNYSTATTKKDTTTAASPPIKDDDVYNEDELGKQDVTELLVAEDLDAEQREREIEKKRNKSRLNRTHLNFLHNKPRPMEDLKTTVSLYQSRKQYAMHGGASGVDPRICFYTPVELADKDEYERIKYPLTVQQMVENVKREKAEKAKTIREREDKIQANLAKLDNWKSELQTRLAKKEAEALVAKTKREQLLEDIRQEIGFKIDFRDPRFKALMEKKELDAKKAKKAEKKQKREELLIARVKEQAQAAMVREPAKSTDDDDVEVDDADDKKVAAAAAAKSKGNASKKTTKPTKDSAKDDSSDSDSDDDKTSSEKKK